MAGWTNRAKFFMLNSLFRGATLPATYYLALVTSAVVPTADTNVFSELIEIAAGNGYTSGGIAVALNATDFDVLTEDDAADRGFIQIKDIAWTAAGGSIPNSGSGARYAVLTDDNVTIGSRLVLVYFDLVSDRTVVSGATLTLQDCELRINES